MSLGSWFRDYVYFPLGGSRVDTKARLVFNLFVTWMLTGIWHGASWNFVFWGFMYFVLLTFEKLTGIEKKLDKSWKRGLYRVFTLFCVIMGWVVFRAPGLRMGGKYMLSMFGLAGNPVFSSQDTYYLISYAVIIIIGIIFSTPVMKLLETKLSAGKTELAYSIVSKIAVLAVFVIAVTFMAGSSYDPFIYFNF